jgi:hypothetical protein
VPWKPSDCQSPVQGPAGLGADEQQGGLCLNLLGAVPLSQLLPNNLKLWKQSAISIPLLFRLWKDLSTRTHPAIKPALE